jgi:pyrroline-5-carboxylate reductase
MVLENSDIVFISVRPDQAKKVLKELNFHSHHTVVSFVPFLKIAELAEVVNPADQVSRAIPLPGVMHHRCPIPILNSHQKVFKVLKYIGKPFAVENENQLHALWTLTGFIAPFYGIFKELGSWAAEKGVEEPVSSKYIVDMVDSMLFLAQKNRQIDFNELIKHSITPKGMNEQAEKEISQKGTYEAFKVASDNLFKRFG